MSKADHCHGVALAVQALSELDPHHIPAAKTLATAREALAILVTEKAGVLPSDWGKSLAVLPVSVLRQVRDDLNAALAAKGVR